MSRRATGIAGEAIAANFLRQHGFFILATNVRTPFGEIDVLARAKDGTVVYCEVRTRLTAEFASPAESIHQRKLQHMIRSAEFIQKRQFQGARLRLDLISVQAGKVVDHLQNIEIA
ncbi:MAG TPA: YraN family protein [Candidatus Saccharimonadia bacterium]|nr:YraN family protein [Candidatus Saccharimonadia bacterium]